MMSTDELLNGPFTADQLRVIRKIVREELIAARVLKRNPVKLIEEVRRTAYPPDLEVGSL